MNSIAVFATISIAVFLLHRRGQRGKSDHVYPSRILLVFTWLLRALEDGSCGPDATNNAKIG